MSSDSFESLLLSQINALHQSPVSTFMLSWEKSAMAVLEHFSIDRLTVFPNSMILLQDNKTLSLSRQSEHRLIKYQYLSPDGSHEQYLRLLRSTAVFRTFDERTLRHSDNFALRKLYLHGARWHAIIPLGLFGNKWGAISLTNFDRGRSHFTQSTAMRIKAIAEMWLCYWQHADLRIGLQRNGEDLQQQIDIQRLEKLTSKQIKILSLLAQGLSAKECGERLFLSPRTIESHKYRMQISLGLDSRKDLIPFALRNGLGVPMVSQKG
ncbi:response regulator transcription factor [Vibrio parahaemolyticus]|uniref:response regulator transcription factor n=1 Tax=Vibrio mediterranei TaxID=689 RepID=UPI0040681D2A